MIIPKIVYQVNSRWFVVNKPKGWSLALRSASAEATVEGFISTIVTDADSKVYFPNELDTRICGLALVCTDRGMQSQFERFKNKHEIEYLYRVVVDPRKQIKRIATDNLKVEIVGEDSRHFDVDVRSSSFLSSKKIHELFTNDVIDHSINLYGLKFPDPLDPTMKEISVIIPRVPFG
jgi:23S rRNA-/tRNA-specific pseudouridylate synthase